MSYVPKPHGHPSLTPLVHPQASSTPLPCPRHFFLARVQEEGEASDGFLSARAGAGASRLEFAIERGQWWQFLLAVGSVRSPAFTLPLPAPGRDGWVGAGPGNETKTLGFCCCRLRNTYFLAKYWALAWQAVLQAVLGEGTGDSAVRS